MEVWVLEWSYPSDSENSVTIWSNQLDAQKQAAKEIIDIIANGFDMDDPTAVICADEIDNMMNRGQYGEVLKRFNDWQDDNNSDYAQYYFVTKKQVLSSDGKNLQAKSSSPFLVSSNGATCRGPCGQYNEYAQADKSDGTHICRQCSTFQHIFGTKP